jgi:uridine kinase
VGGAGKTTFVKELEKELREKEYPVVVLHIDDHIVERKKRYKTGDEEWFEYYCLQWDIEMLRTELFEKIHTDCKNLTLHFYHQKTDTISCKSIEIQPTSIVLIEGIFLQRKEWREYFNYRIFVDYPRELRVERVLKRDTYIGDKEERLNKYKKRYWLGEEHYIKVENPLSNANIVYSTIS